MYSLSIVIPTYRRGEILLETIQRLLELSSFPAEILVVDQTEKNPPEVESFFQCLEKKSPDIGKAEVRRIMMPRPSIPHAMNTGLKGAKGDIVLFLDDDIIPDRNLISAHLDAYELFPAARAVVGQVFQPEDNLQTVNLPSCSSGSGLRKGPGFKFNGSQSMWVEDVIACNLSIQKEFALCIGGFDEHFIPPVSYRFETEFAKRLIGSGGKIRFEPSASIQHLRAGEGGTRSQGVHLKSASPVHGVGDYYYALRCGTGGERLRYMLKRPFREVRTRFHLTHPWYIPVKLIGECRAAALAFKLNRKGPRLLSGAQRIVLVSTAQPDRPDGSMVRYGVMVREALESHTACRVEELNLSPTQAWLDHFPVSLQTSLRYFCIAWNARHCLPKQKGAVVHLLDGSHAYFLPSLPALSSPVVITVHDLIPALCARGELAGVRPGKAAEWILRKAVAGLSRADWIAAVSENTRKDVCRIAPVDAGRTGVVYSSVNVPGNSEPVASEEMPYILHVAGNNNFYKNRAGVVEIFQVIRAAVPVRLKLAGAPPDEALKNQIEASGIADDLEFCTHVSEEELATLYRGAAFLLFPSFYEGFGWPPLEAMALGCPVLCSSAGSLAEIAGEAAWTAAPDDTQAFAKYGIRLLNEPEERRRRVDAGIQHLRSFSMKAMAEGFADIYRRAERAKESA